MVSPLFLIQSILMHVKELLENEPKWHKKAMIISLFHNTRDIIEPNWTIAQTATELNISTGRVCEDLLLAEKIRQDGTIIQLSRNKALKKLRRK
jgi:hypothetical protein